MEIVLILFLLQLKHLIVDWCWQPPYEYLNKGTYGHWGGIRHSLKNAVGTALCFVPFCGIGVVIFVVIADFLVHYHTDFTKMNINKYMKWGPTTHEEFWKLTGLDQFVHQVTYLVLVYFFLV